MSFRTRQGSLIFRFLLLCEMQGDPIPPGGKKQVNELVLIAFQVNPHYQIPIRAIVLVSAIVVVLSLIHIGSTTAFTAILSLSTLSLYISYLIPITIFILCKLRKEAIQYGPFRMGLLGLYINIIAIVYGVFICIFLPFPPERPLTKANMNYSSPVFVFVLLFSLGDWLVRGRKIFIGPIREVSSDDFE